MRKRSRERREQENRRALENAVLEAALAEHTFEVPEAMVLRQVGHQIEHIREQMRRQGMDPERVPWDYQKLSADMRPGAEKAVKRALLIEAIAEKEGLARERRRRGCRDRAPRAGEPASGGRRARHARAERRPGSRIRASLGEKRTLDFLIERAAVTPEVH